jgi:signal transduction histidine kinase/ligand-binding sensor domain-containing protein/DNA-binding response OmpR family regulator
MKGKTLNIILILVYSHCSCLLAIHESIRIENYSHKDGLATSGVNSVYKDSRGFLWLCTQNGLFRYDGYSFKNINTIVFGGFKYEALCIVEDKDKNFWIGTASKGIFFYNKHTGRILSVKLSEGSNSKVYKILFFQKRIWIATSFGLLVVNEKDNYDFNSILKTRVLWPDSLHKGLQMNVINYIYVQPGSTSIWVGTNGPLYELNTRTYSFSLINSQNQNSIRCLSAYTDKKIIASSWDGGIFTVNPYTHKLENDQFINEINRIVGNKRVQSAVLDKQKRCWVATFGDGLYVFDKNKSGEFWYENYLSNDNKYVKLNSNFINQIYPDSCGIVWLSMFQAGLSKVYYQSGNFNYFNFSGAINKTKTKEIFAVNQSTDKNKFWVNFNEKGLALFDSQNYSYKIFTANNTPLQLQNDKISLTYQDKRGNLWIVYSRHGLYVLLSEDAKKLTSGGSSKVTPLDANNLLSKDPRRNSYITTFFEDSKGRLWINAWCTVYIIDFRDRFSAAKDPNQLLRYCKSYLIYSDDQKDRFDFPISPVNSFVEMGNNKYWLGTKDAGIIQLEEISDFCFNGKNLSLNEKLPSNDINCLYMDKANDLWIGSNSGLCKFSKGSLETINVKNGLSTENITNIIEDHSHQLWVSNSYGISIINKKDFSIENFFYTDRGGFSQYLANAASITTNGHIWCATNESLVMFDPDSTEISSSNVPVFFTDIKINNNTIIPLEKYRGTQIIETDINECKVIHVPYGSSLNIEFAAFDYLAPERKLYKYKISNSDEWIQLSPGQRSLTLPNMNPGEYTLSVKVANSYSEASVRSVRISYLPPFWLSKIAYAIYTGVILLFLFLYRRLIIQKTLQKSLIEKERYERKKLEELDKMKSEFFSNISHEFRTPLSLIINPLETLAEKEDISDKNKDKIRLILKSSNRLLKLTNELMDFGKIEKELLVPDFQLCEIVSVTDEICLLFNNMADTMNIDFKINYSYERLEIPMDKEMIEKSIFNLLSNAFKYTARNGVIMVNISKIHNIQEEFVKISVINTGEGIDKANIDKVFDRYYQVNNFHNKNIEGTGIGLALVKNFVELHNGRVEVKSEPNLETCFDIYLPVIQPQYTGVARINHMAMNKMLKNIHLIQDNILQINKPTSHYRVLVIEDDEDIRNYIIDELASDYRVLYAKNGQEGLCIANESIPDLIVTDVIMPGLSGIELCRKLKNQVITSHVPIIILSAKANIDQQIEGLEMGADVYMVKPFNIDHLKAQIQRLISFKQAIYLRFLKETELIPKDSVNNKLDEEFMRKVMTFIEKNLTNSDLCVDQLANCVALSKVQTYRKVKAISGLSVVEFIRAVRLKKAAQMVLEGKFNFSEIAYETGFSTPSYFTKCFHSHFGKTPSEFLMEYGNKQAL